MVVPATAAVRVAGFPIHWEGLSPDDSPLLLRDTAAQEIYAWMRICPRILRFFLNPTYADTTTSGED